jgi:hypothetical protein
MPARVPDVCDRNALAVILGRGGGVEIEKYIAQLHRDVSAVPPSLAF